MSDPKKPAGRPGEDHGRAGREAAGKRAEDLAGPHAAPELTNPDATPGAGALPSDDEAGDVDPGAG